MKLAIAAFVTCGMFLTGSAWAQGGPLAGKVLCVSLHGQLILRTACKKQETLVDGGSAGTIGIKGDSGGLAVKDSLGKEVGFPLGFYGYYGYSATTVAFQAVAVGDTSSSFFTGTVDASGFQLPDAFDENFLYATGDCSGTKYGRSISGATVDLFRPLTLSSDGSGYFTRTGDVLVHGQFFTVQVTFSATAAGAITLCRNQGGNVVGDAVSCPVKRFGIQSCVRCCISSPTTDAAPLRRVDLGALGLTPPFRITH